MLNYFYVKLLVVPRGIEKTSAKSIGKTLKHENLTALYGSKENRHRFNRPIQEKSRRR